jgi:hypothetical protein
MRSPHHLWSFSVRCPGCDTECTVRVVEDAGPPFGDTPRRDYTVSDGFRVTPGTPATLKCLGCGAVFASPHELG